MRRFLRQLWIDTIWMWPAILAVVLSVAIVAGAAVRDAYGVGGCQ